MTMMPVDEAFRRSEKLADDLMRMVEGKGKGECLYAFAISLIALSHNMGVTREGFIESVSNLWDEMAERMPHAEPKGQA